MQEKTNEEYECLVEDFENIGYSTSDARKAATKVINSRDGQMAIAQNHAFNG